MIPLFRPEYDAAECAAINSVLNARWSGMGPVVEDFEEKFAALCKAKYAVAMNSCTSALELAYRWYRARTSHNHTATVPSLTFCSTAQAAIRAGLGVKFVDVEPDTLVRKLGDEETKNFRGHVHTIVHYGGRHWVDDGINVLHDCAHCSPLEFKQPPLGICCWSFEAKKIISTGDGGMITTNDEEAAKKFRQWRWCGISRSTWDRSKGTGYAWDYDIPENAPKCHMNDLIASIGSTQMEKLPRVQDRRRAIYQEYINHFSGHVDYIRHGGDSGHSLFVIRAKKRDELFEYLKEHGITAGVHYKPLHLHEAFKNCRQTDLANTMRAWDQILSLPVFPSMTNDQVGIVASAVLAHQKSIE